MAVTGRQMLDMALVLIDEVNEAGGIVPDNPDYYETKALTFLSIVQSELLASDIEPPIVTNLDDDLVITQRMAIRACAYGLASKLALAEDVNLFTSLNAMYDEMKRKIPALPVPITDVYGVSTGEDDE